MSGRVQHFTDLIVWRESHELFLSVLRDAKGWPTLPAAKVVLEQLIRSCASISANIAEGFGRSQRRFVHCLDIAVGEANETENWLYKVRDAGFTPPDAVRDMLASVIGIEKMLRSLRGKIKARPDRVAEAAEWYLASDEEGAD